jgi:hypothetical protein
MKRMTTAAVTLLLAVALAGAEPTPPKEPAKPAPDTKPTTEMARQVHEKLALPTDKLYGLAREERNRTLAELKYGPALARAQVRLQQLERAHIDVQDMAQQLRKERQEMKQQLDYELDQTRQTFKDNRNLCEEEQVALIRSFLPTLQRLKAQEESCARLEGQIRARLEVLRRQKASLERTRRLVEQGIVLGTAQLPPTIGGLGLEEDDPELSEPDADTKEPAGGKKKQSLDELKKLLEGL